MDTTRYNEVIDNSIRRCTATLCVKSDEYSTDEDRLCNFKVAAKLQGCTPITALAGMMAKHTVSVYDLIHRHEQGIAVSKDMWDEKIGDSINYLLLLSALVQEDIDERPCEENSAEADDIAIGALIRFLREEETRLTRECKELSASDMPDTYKCGFRAGNNAGGLTLVKKAASILGV